MQTHTVTVMRDTLGRHGDPATTATHTIDGCITAPASTSEGDERGAQVVVGLTLFAPYDADLLPNDRVVVDDVTYDVQGEPGRWASPYSGRRRGLQVALRRTT